MSTLIPILIVAIVVFPLVSLDTYFNGIANVVVPLVRPDTYFNRSPCRL
jgi:hypothetical protein